MKIKMLLIALFTILLFTACNNGPKAILPKSTHVYTSINMWYVDGNLESDATEGGASAMVSGENIPLYKADYRVASTNYKRDILLPVNSKVELIFIEDDKIFFKFNNEIYGIDNIEKHSKVDINTLLKRSFSSKKTDLSIYSDVERKDISQGTARIGMTKSAVLVARGYPPGHITPNLESDSWRYWEHRFNSRMYHFRDGKYTGYTE